MTCLIKIRSLRENMSANEKKLADFVLENTGLIRDYSSQQLASAVGISQSSVVKFSQKLGYRGYPDLKMAIYESLSHEVTSTTNTAAGGASLRQKNAEELLFGLKQEAIETTVALNSKEKFDQAAGALRRAERVQVFGAGLSGLAARSLAYHLMLTGKAVVNEAEVLVQLAQADGLGKGGVFVVISETGEDSDAVALTQRAKSAGATVIAICRCGTSPVSLLSDIVLEALVDRGQTNLSSLLLAAAQQHLVDILVSRFN
ncbi:MurR/RpiR family transcriptional regulator [Biformimicrobium ophioploci]|uniref:MurR/RpiR family transcriptional regulator n=1 Tax=Biformimicrobium ophioploci TaxID=3036711 RepID=A0ABQ6LZC0_9GAMM|nr:MurR/RpiR family transcriptional regulator [Microbulbifer sp. NKW57]GMG87422.1 MurR/RpiR family transcriptional regulator [Microbulbifer sp. NKW57]